MSKRRAGTKSELTQWKRQKQSISPLIAQAHIDNIDNIDNIHNIDNIDNICCCCSRRGPAVSRHLA